MSYIVCNHGLRKQLQHSSKECSRHCENFRWGYITIHVTLTLFKNTQPHVPLEARRGCPVPGTGRNRCCEPPDGSVGNWALVLWKSRCSDLQSSQPQRPTLIFDFSVRLSSVQEAVMLRLISLGSPFKPSLSIVTVRLVSRRDSSFAVLRMWQELETRLHQFPGFVCCVGV